MYFSFYIHQVISFKPLWKRSSRTRTNLFSPLSKPMEKSGGMTKSHQGLIANSQDRSHKLLSYRKALLETRSLFKAHCENVIGEKCRGGTKIESYSRRCRHVVVDVLGRRRSVISRARARMANRISENVRAIRRRWKSEEKSKGRARLRVSGGEEI